MEASNRPLPRESMGLEEVHDKHVEQSHLSQAANLTKRPDDPTGVIIDGFPLKSLHFRVLAVHQYLMCIFLI